jgi:hypothetical protein
MAVEEPRAFIGQNGMLIMDQRHRPASLSLLPVSGVKQPDHGHRRLLRATSVERESVASVIDTIAIARMNASMQNSPGQS